MAISYGKKEKKLQNKYICSLYEYKYIFKILYRYIDGK